MARNANAPIWNYFERNSTERFAECNYCNKMLSYKTTIANLKNHLKFHDLVYQDFVNETKRLEEAATIKLEESEGEERELFSYFHVEGGGRVRCGECGGAVTHDENEMKRHLRQKHKDLVVVDLEEGSDVNQEVYTEVVYVDQETKRPEKRKAERNTKQDSPEEPPKKPHNDEEIEQFGKYITCLLKKMPEKTSSKLQRDIINLIMDEKFKLKSENVDGSFNVLEQN